MKKKRLIFLLVLLAVASAFALFVKIRDIQNAKGLPMFISQAICPLPTEAPIPFDCGEQLNFVYSLGPLKTGSAKLTFAGKTTVNGRDAFMVTFESSVGAFYDKEDIYADTKTFYPILVERKIKNFTVAANIKEEYDQAAFEVKITKKGLFGTTSDTIKKQNPIQNALLLIYYCRKLLSSELDVGHEFDVVLPVDEFKVKLTKIEKIKVPAGTFEAYLFESTPRKIKLWIAKDKKHTPLKMENLTSFGPSSIALEKITTAAN